jgi:hypothetical protein
MQKYWKAIVQKTKDLNTDQKAPENKRTEVLKN